MPTAMTEEAPAGRACAVVALLGAGLAGCASAGGPPPLPDADLEACRPTGEAARPGTITVAAAGEIDPLHAPVPTSDAERLLFRQLYATLVEVDCRGRLRPGLAEDWSSGEDGATWTFRLDPDARFADGDPVTAGAVVTAWHQTDLTAGPGRPSPLEGASVSAPAERTLVVRLDTAVSEPAVFAAPRFAVTGGGGISTWPAPSGAFRPAERAGERLPGGSVALAPRGDGPGDRARSHIRLVAFGAAGARDILDAGADLLLTRDPGVARYAGSLARYRVHPLPWDRVWALAVPGRRAAGAGSDSAAWAAVRGGLAGEAVPAEARPADGPLPWAACPAEAPIASLTWRPGGGREPGAAGSAGRRPAGARADGRPGAIVHPADEPSGRALAARLVALSGGAGPEGEVVAHELAAGASGLRTEALSPAAYHRSLRRGAAAAYLVALPRRPLAPCRLWRDLRRQAPWLADGGRLVPLVETRPLLVLGSDVAGVRLDWDGMPRLEAAGRP